MVHWISEFLKALSTDPLFGIFGIIIGIGLSLILYFRSIKERRPFYCVTGTRLISAESTNLADLQILFRGQQVRNITVTNILFWNEGAETIRAGDVAESDSLRIETAPDTKLLDCRIVYVTTPQNQFLLQESASKEIFVRFEFIDRNQGVVIQIVHDGARSGRVRLNGTVYGFGKIQRRQVLPAIPSYFNLDKRSRRMARVLRYFMGAYLLMFAGACVSGGIAIALGEFNLWVKLIGEALLGLFLLAVIGIIRQFFKTQLPAGLRAYGDLESLQPEGSQKESGFNP
ncbi:MAG: hypothetical protein H7343_10720 [Undibacterium sp.]|nr:hypothetical protein [Opitutaceae bacterium]